MRDISIDEIQCGLCQNYNLLQIVEKLRVAELVFIPECIQQVHIEIDISHFCENMTTFDSYR